METKEKLLECLSKLEENKLELKFYVQMKTYDFDKADLERQRREIKKTKEEELKKAEQIFQKQLQQKEEELNTRVTAEKQKIQQEHVCVKNN